MIKGAVTRQELGIEPKCFASAAVAALKLASACKVNMYICLTSSVAGCSYEGACAVRVFKWKDREMNQAYTVSHFS